MLIGHAVSAQTTWDTAPVSGQLTNTNNWLGDAVPADNTSWVYTNSSVTALTNGFVDYTVAGITFTTNASAYTMGGNAFTLTGGMTNNSTSLQTISNALTINSAVNLSNTGNLGSPLLTLLGNLSGSGTITYGSVATSGRLTLSGNNSGLNGAFIANSGRVNLNASAASAGADYTFNNSGNTFLTTANSTFNFGSLSGSATLANNTANNTNTVSIGAKGASTTFSGNISANQSGTIDVVKVGGGTLTLSGNNNYIGATTISNGVLQIGAGGTSGTISNTASITLDGGSLAFHRSDNVTQGVNFLSNGSTLTGTGGFIQMGSGTTTLTAANTYTGSTVVSGGALLLSNGSAIQSSALNMAGGSLLFDGALTAVTTGGLNGTGGLVLTNHNGDAVTLTLANSVSTLLNDATIISGTGGLSLSGAGTQTFSGASTFSGGFVLGEGAKVRVGASSATVSAGAVTASSLGAGAITINGGTIFGNSGLVGSTNTTIGANFAVNEGVTGGLNGRLRLFGAFDMAGGEKTVSLGRYTNSAASVLPSGPESLRFESVTNGPSTTFTNGTLRFVRDASGAAGDYVSVRFDAFTGVFYDGAGFTVGSNVITVLGSSFVFNTSGSRPQVGVEAGGYFNLSDNINVRNASIQTLSGEGTVTSLASNSATSTLTILPNAGDNRVFSGQIVDGSSLTSLVSGAATTLALTLNGAGTQTLSGANTYTGATTISAGTLQIGNGGTTGSLSASSTVANNSTLVFHRSNDLAQGTDFSTAAITGTGNLVKLGAGTLRLNAANTYAGDTSLEAGAIAFALNNALGSGTVTMSAGTRLGAITGNRSISNNIFVLGDVAFSGFGTGSTLNGNIDLGGAARTITLGNSTTFNGVISNGSIVLAGVADFVTMALTASNSFSDVTVNGGALRLSGAGALSSSAAVTLASVLNTTTLDLTNVSASSVTIGSLAGDATNARVNLGDKELIVGGNNNSTTFAGVISNTGSLTKTGVGTFTLSATNTYTGATTVAGGELAVNGSISGSVVTVQNSGVLSGSGTVGATVVSSGATLSPGNSPGTLSIDGDLTWNGGGNYDWEIFNLGGPAGTGWDVIDVSGELLLGSLSAGNKFNLNLFSLSGINPDVAGALSGWNSSLTNSWTIVRTANGITGFDAANFNLNVTGFTAYNNTGNGLFSLALDGNDLNLMFSPGGTPIPEPGTWAVGALLAIAAGFAARRRSRRVAGEK